MRQGHPVAVTAQCGVATAMPWLARSVFAVAGVAGAVLVALSGGYGYHRDELYFLVAVRIRPGSTRISRRSRRCSPG